MRIAFVSLMAGSPWAASEVLWAAAAQRALGEGHEVFASTYDWQTRPAALEDLERRGARLDLRPLSRWQRRSAQITRVTRTFAALEEFEADVICVNQGGTYDLARSGSIGVLRSTLARMGTPYILLCHCEQPPPPARNLQKARQMFARAAIVGMVADRLRGVSEAHLGLPLPNVRIFHNPVNLRQIEYLPWPASPSPLRFAFVGRLDPVKNLESLIAAFTAEQWRDRDWTLTVHGAGPDRSLLERQAIAANLGERIRFAGYVDDITAVWATHHALLMPSRFEGVPLAMVEAMLCGRPVVATDVGGIAEWLEESRSGFLIEAPTPEKIGAALERLWKHREHMEELGRYAHGHTMEKRDIDPAGTLLDWLQQAAPAARRIQHCPPVAPRQEEASARPLLSVVIPTYEPEQFLIEAVRSVLSQDPGPAAMQIVVVDDGSKGTRPAALLEGIAPAGRIEFHEYADNLGLAGNWNRGISVARGQFVHLLHQDDTVHAGFYSKLLAGLERSPDIGMAFCRHAFIGDDNRIERISHLERRHPGVLPRWLERICETQRIQCPAVIVRREVYEALGGFRTDLRYALDWEMWARIASRHAVWYEPEVLANYRRHARTETARLEAVGQTSSDTMAAIEILATHTPLARRASIRRRAYRRLVRSHLRRASKLLEAGVPQLAAKQLDSASAALGRLPENLRTRLSRNRLERLAAQAGVSSCMKAPEHQTSGEHS